MKKILYLLICFCWVNVVVAQSAKDEIYANIRLSAANYLAYPEPNYENTPPPAGYKPFYLSAYARHGSRYRVDKDDYEIPLAILKEANMYGVLTDMGQKTLFVVDSLSRMSQGRYGELTPLGSRQHREIASRMFYNFPEVFQGRAEIDARSTVVIRCILSMTAECLQLQSMNPKLIIKNDASYADMYYMNNEDAYYKELTKSAEVQETRADFQKKHLHPERLMKSLFNNDDYVKWKVDAGKLMSYLFELAINMQSHDTEMELYSLFTKEECYDLWQINNLSWYIRRGASPLTKGEMPYLEANLLENIINTADSCLEKKENSATLRFGHESCVLPLACLMELGNCAYETSNVENLSDVWQNYRIFPMACNIQLVFYHKKKNDDIIVKILLNEQEMKLPFLASKIAPYYHWKDVEAYYRNKIDSYRIIKN